MSPGEVWVPSVSSVMMLKGWKLKLLLPVKTCHSHAEARGGGLFDGRLFDSYHTHVSLCWLYFSCHSALRGGGRGWRLVTASSAHLGCPEAPWGLGATVEVGVPCGRMGTACSSLPCTGHKIIEYLELEGALKDHQVHLPAHWYLCLIAVSYGFVRAKGAEGALSVKHIHTPYMGCSGSCLVRWVPH